MVVPRPPVVPVRSIGDEGGAIVVIRMNCRFCSYGNGLELAIGDNMALGRVSEVFMYA